MMMTYTFLIKTTDSHPQVCKCIYLWVSRWRPIPVVVYISVHRSISQIPHGSLHIVIFVSYVYSTSVTLHICWRFCCKIDAKTVQSKLLQLPKIIVVTDYHVQIRSIQSPETYKWQKKERKKYLEHTCSWQPKRILPKKLLDLTSI